MTHAIRRNTAEDKHNTSAVVVPRANTLTHRTTTHISRSADSDPSELGSEPDSWVEYRPLRAREIAHTHVSRD